jgi:hypothetical protein
MGRVRLWRLLSVLDHYGPRLVEGWRNRKADDGGAARIFLAPKRDPMARSSWVPDTRTATKAKPTFLDRDSWCERRPIFANFLVEGHLGRGLNAGEIRQVSGGRLLFRTIGRVGELQCKKWSMIRFPNHRPNCRQREQTRNAQGGV